MQKPVVCFAITTLVLAACGDSGSAAARPLMVERLYGASQCGDVAPGITRLSDAGQLADIVRARGVLSLEGTPIANGTPIDELSFGDRLVLLISEGQRSTGGYGISLTSEQAWIEDSILKLPVDFEQPAPEALVAQVLTSPCLVVAVEAGDYERVEAGPYELMLEDDPE